MRLSDSFLSDASSSFKIVCLELLEAAYTKVLAAGVVSREWDENAISEVLVSKINDDSNAIAKHITAITEKRLLPKGLASAPASVDDAHRIDINIGGFGWSKEEHRTTYFMEAKNLYCNGFIKKGNKSKTSPDKYAQRYINTGIDNLLNGHYPLNTLLLGYVLEGTVHEAVKLVNKHLVKNSRPTERIVLRKNTPFPRFKFGASHHQQSISIEHCFLSFDHRRRYNSHSAWAKESSLL